MNYIKRLSNRLQWRSGGAALSILVTLLIAGVHPVLAQQITTKVTEIVVQGNKALNREGIIGASGLKLGQSISKNDLDVATRNLVSTGNFGARKIDNPEDAVKISADIDQKSGDAKVTIVVDENDLVKGFNITGAGPVQPKVLQDLMQTKIDRVLNLNILRGDIERIQDYYKNKGYQALVSPDGFGLTNGILDIPVVVGKIGKIKLNGLHKTKPRVVMRELYDTKSGSYYNVNKLQKAYTRIFNTDLFSDIQPAILTPTPGVVDLTMNLEEKRTGTVSASVGYSSRNSLLGRVEIGESNVFGLGQQANFMWEVGGLANRSSFEVGFTEPWLDRKHTSAAISLYDRVVYRFGNNISSNIGSGNTAGTGTDYFETHKGGTVTLSRPISDFIRLYTGFRYDNVKVPSLNLNLTDASVLQNGPLAVVSISGKYNTRDYDQDPASGRFDTLTADFGHAKLSPVTVAGLTPNGIYGSLNYTKMTADTRTYFSPRGKRKSPKDKRTVLALRLMMGTSTGKLPFSEQFFMGGAESLRGYSEDRYWGSNMVLSSFEFRQPLANSLTGVLFMDVGDAWGGSYEKVKFNGFNQHSGLSPSMGLGFGLRVVTPIGPIRIDEGFGRDGAHTHFSIGHVF
ncbi:MAG: BamA/TamA family outer membrane protein [Chthonomonadales bacterium]